MESYSKKYTNKSISLLGAFALSIGTSIGWGSFVLTSSSYLGKAGPIGSIIGLVIGMIIMIILAYNYHVMINKYPNTSGGIYTYAKNTFSADHGFFVGWFLIIIYMAILWANVASIPIFARYFCGETFQFGFLYQIGGYDIYLGEILLSIAFILLFGGLTLVNKKITSNIQIGLVLFFISAIIFVFIISMVKHNGGFKSFEPGFSDDGDSAFKQILAIVSMSPWAFIGFESISNSSHHFMFKVNKVFKVLLFSVVFTALTYIIMCIISISIYPDNVSNWYEYITNTNNYSGISAIPLFFVAKKVLGTFGVVLFALTLLAIVITSVIGNMFGLTNVVFAMAEDNIFPHKVVKLDKNESPYIIKLIIIAFSICILFVGKAAIGWIVDVNTFGGAIIYGYISACVIKQDKDNIKQKISGIIGLVLSVIFGLLVAIPNIFMNGDVAKESFFIFSIWSSIGFIIFSIVVRRDKIGLFGHSMIVWLGGLILTFFSSIMFVADTLRDSNDNIIKMMADYYGKTGMTDDLFIGEMRGASNLSITISIVILIVVFALSQIVLFSVFKMVKNKEVEKQKELDIAKELATTDTMTGVKNKHAYSTKVSLIDEAIEKGLELDFALVVCDVNNLKYMNDNYGHEFGDKLIIDACHIICNVFKHSSVYRIGGDEFIVIMESSDYENRNELVDTLNNISIQNAKVDGGVVIASGLAVFEKDSDNAFVRVFSRADQAMYNRKQELKKIQNMIKK